MVSCNSKHSDPLTTSQNRCSILCPVSGFPCAAQIPWPPQPPALGLCSGYSLSNYNNVLKIFVNKTWFHNLIGLSPRIGFVMDNQFIIKYASVDIIQALFRHNIYLFQKLQQYHQHRRSSSFIGPVSFQRNFIVLVFVFVSKIVPLNLVVQMTKVTER